MTITGWLHKKLWTRSNAGVFSVGHAMFLTSIVELIFYILGNLLFHQYLKTHVVIRVATGVVSLLFSVCSVIGLRILQKLYFRVIDQPKIQKLAMATFALASHPVEYYIPPDKWFFRFLFSRSLEKWENRLIELFRSLKKDLEKSKQSKTQNAKLQQGLELYTEQANAFLELLDRAKAHLSEEQFGLWVGKFQCQSSPKERRRVHDELQRFLADLTGNPDERKQRKLADFTRILENLISESEPCDEVRDLLQRNEKTADVAIKIENLKRAIDLQRTYNRSVAGQIRSLQPGT